ncbi:MAG: ACT domain-containing protein [Rikenellaceae bacterium]
MAKYTLTVFSENHAGVLGLITTVFTSRHMNIEMLKTERSSIEGIHRFIIEVTGDVGRVENVARQIEKKIDVMKAYIQTTEEYAKSSLTPERERDILAEFIVKK